MAGPGGLDENIRRIGLLGLSDTPRWSGTSWSGPARSAELTL